MWPDNETTNDLIGFRVHADLIRAVVTNAAMLPITIGIFGDWGGGKTSIMKMLEHDLDPEHWPAGSSEYKQCESIAVVYVNTWLFEGYDDAKAALLGSILSELAEHKRFGPKIRDGVISLLKSVHWMRATRLAMQHVVIPTAAAFFTGGTTAILQALAASVGLASIFPIGGSSTEKEADDNKEKIDVEKIIKQDSSQAQAVDVRTFRQRFGKMLTDGGIKTLVVLIDDLDRCTPERIIENLEAVKLFLSVEQTAFVVGADRRIVEHAIRSRYAERAIEDKDEQTKALVKDYLEKLVQVPYSLPRLSATEIETYMTLLFCQQHLSPSDFSLCLKACEESRAKNRYASFCYAGVRTALKDTALNSDLTASLTLAAASSSLIADGLKGNPRQVKRFLNTLLLRKELARVARLNNIRDDVLVKLMILEYVQTDHFTQLFTWQSLQNGYPQEIANLEVVLAGAKGDVKNEEAAKKIDPKWATTAIRRWIAMDPLLKDVDLRDYFWIARDRLESTFSGISMVPPIVRAVLDGLISGAPPDRNTAMATAKKLTEDERISLLNLIDQLIARQPEDKSGYDAIRCLIESDIPGSAELLVKTLTQRPLDNVPANIGMDFMTLYKKKSELNTILDPAKNLLLKSDTRIGKAAKSAK